MSPPKAGAQPEVESPRDDVDGTQHAKQELCEGDTKGAEEHANPIDEDVKTPYGYRLVRPQSLTGAAYGAVWVLPHFWRHIWLGANAKGSWIRRPLRVSLIRRELIVYS